MKLKEHLLVEDQKMNFSISIKEDAAEKLKFMGWLKKTAVAKKIKKTDISLSYGSEFERMVYERFMQYLNERKEVKNIISDINTNISNGAQLD